MSDSPTPLDPAFNQLVGKHRLSCRMFTYANLLFYSCKAIKLIGIKQLCCKVSFFLKGKPVAFKKHIFRVLKPLFLVMFEGCGARELTELDGIKKSRNESLFDSLEKNCKCET